MAEMRLYLENHVPFLQHKEKMLLLALLNGDTVTRQEAIAKFNIQNLPAAVKRMRDNGIWIDAFRYKSEFNPSISYVIYGLTEETQERLKRLGRIIYNYTLKAWLPAY